MADYAGAVAAMRDYFVAAWVSGGSQRTPIGFQNEGFADQTTAWVYFEVLLSTSKLQGAGTPGAHVWLYSGNIYVHVFVPKDEGAAEGVTLAVAAGEIFRTKQFYNTDPGCLVRTGVGPEGEGPQIDGGGSGADDGSWWRVTCTIPFEYWHLG